MTTLARPYAFATFECAQANNTLSEWEIMLTAAANVAKDSAVTRLLNLPEMNPEQLSKLFCDVLSNVLDEEKRNLISLLAAYKRLPLLPEIAELFKSYRAAFEKVLNVNVSSAETLNDKVKNNIVAALQKRLKQKIILECKVDPSLLGGIVVRVNDLVMDGSVHGQLKRLLDSLMV